MSQLLGPDGRPIDTTLLSQEFAAPQLTGLRSAWMDSVAAGLTPRRLAQIMRAADQGDGHDYLTLAEEMEEREPQYGTVLGVRKRAIQGLEVQINAASDSPEDVALADEVRELFDAPEIMNLIGDMLDALGKGYSVVEIMWETSAARWTPAAFLWRDPRFFQVDRLTGRQIRLRDGTMDGADLPAYKFVRQIFRLKSGQPLRGGLARFAAWSFLAKSYTLKDWLSFLENYGMPIRLGRYGATATPEDQLKLLRAVRAISSYAAAIIPDTMNIEFPSADKSGTGSASSVFSSLASYLDEALSKIVLGQTLTTDKGASRAAAQVHDGVRKDILVSDARQVAATLKRDLVQAYVDLNHGMRVRYPHVELVIRDNADIKVMSDALEKLVPMGLKVQVSEVRDYLGFADPKPGSELLIPPATSSTAPKAPVALNRHAGACPCCGGLALNRASDVPSEIERVGAEHLAEWEVQLDPMLRPIFDMIENAGSLQEIRDALPGLYDRMDTSELERRLRAATSIARGLGDIGKV